VEKQTWKQRTDVYSGVLSTLEIPQAKRFNLTSDGEVEVRVLWLFTSVLPLDMCSSRDRRQSSGVWRVALVFLHVLVAPPGLREDGLDSLLDVEILAGKVGGVSGRSSWSDMELLRYLEASQRYFLKDM